MALSQKVDVDFYFLNPRIVFSALILGNLENPPLLSDLKPPLTLDDALSVQFFMLVLLDKKCIFDFFTLEQSL